MKMIDKEKVIKGLECCASMDGGACRECPYSSDCIAEEATYQTGTAHLAADALAMLKEQEPRVLNWDEVGNYSFVYGEFRGVKEIFPLIITKDTSGRILSWNPKINRSGEHLLLVSDEEDRRNTRCWNREPTDEQRKAVKWDA